MQPVFGAIVTGYGTELRFLFKFIYKDTTVKGTTLDKYNLDKYYLFFFR